MSTQPNHNWWTLAAVCGATSMPLVAAGQHRAYVSGTHDPLLALIRNV